VLIWKYIGFSILTDYAKRHAAFHMISIVGYIKITPAGN
jgi:hypothetical protein